MDFEQINKAAVTDPALEPNLTDYASTRADFDWWRDAFEHMDWLPGGGLNNAYEAVDRHVAHGHGDKLAMIWIGKNGEEERYTYAEFKRESDRFGAVMQNLGIELGDRVFIFMDRLPELYIAAMGVLKAGGVIAPLFSAFGPDPVRDRMLDAGAKYLITSPDLRGKIASILPDIETLRDVIIVNKDGRSDDPPIEGDLDYFELMSAADPDAFNMAETTQYDFAIMHYTSGSTGQAQRCVASPPSRHPAMDYRPLGTRLQVRRYLLLHGGPRVGDRHFLRHDGAMDQRRHPDHLRRRLQRLWVVQGHPGLQRHRLVHRSHRHPPPDAAGGDVVDQYDMSSLRFIGSVGEPLNPEAVVWGNRHFDMPIHDNWWQTETGAIMCANFQSMAVRPGSMGRPFPGITMGVLDDQFNELGPGNAGSLAVRPGWPSMMYTYWQQDEMYNSRFKKGWYITGDQASIDEDGYFWFQGRADDVINTAGHLVGPFEVESALIEHEAVAEAGVIGKPDPIAMEIVKAFVTLNPGYEAGTQLRRELMRFARDRLSAGVAPREIDFIDIMPKTRSGKIMRRLFKARELGLPEGDTSTLEDD